MEFIRAGGFSMFVLLALGAVMIPTAIRFASDADPQRLSLLRALNWVVVAASFAGFITGLAATCRHVVADPQMIKDPMPVLLIGFAESCTNIILGGAIAVVTWILIAVGIRRMPHDNL
jgi:hypothetical protein